MYSLVIPCITSVYPRSPDLSQTLPCSLHVIGGCSRIAGSCPAAARKRVLSEWAKANPDTVYDPELFRREILPELAGHGQDQDADDDVVARSVCQ